MAFSLSAAILRPSQVIAIGSALAAASTPPVRSAGFRSPIAAGFGYDRRPAMEPERERADFYQLLVQGPGHRRNHLSGARGARPEMLDRLPRRPSRRELPGSDRAGAARGEGHAAGV